MDVSTIFCSNPNYTNWKIYAPGDTISSAMANLVESSL